MSALTDDRLSPRLVTDPDPETVTARRRESIRVLGVYLPPSQYELDFYARQHKTPPTD